jgi:predicted XRE-type DNA-binding protein
MANQGDAQLNNAAYLTYNDSRKKKRAMMELGRGVSNQMSMQSDITETVEVSERSFNDKLAKLKIHSFQNVKFMSQLKKE